MRAWDPPPQEGVKEREEAGAPASRPVSRPPEIRRPWRRLVADLVRAGIDLHPRRPGERRSPTAEPAAHLGEEAGEANGRPLLGIVGAGAVGTALGVAFHRAGWPVVAVASRDPRRRERFQSLVPGVRAFADPQPLVDEVDVVILTVPDDAIRLVAGALRLYAGQAVVHTSGLLGSEVLAPAMAAGTRAGSFHPLVAFADLERAVAALRGATIAVEGDDDLVPLLAEMAEALGAVPVRLPPGAKPAYHAAAVLAAGGLVALLDAVVELGRAVGLDETGALAVYGRLAEQTLANARALGVRAALTGPVIRGDVGTLRAHLAALAERASGVLPLYRAAAEREIAIALERGAIDDEVAARLRSVLAPARAERPEEG